MAGADLDAALLAAQLGEPWALRVLYDALAPAVQGYLKARGAAEPEELTSDVFVTVFTKLTSLTGGSAGLRTFAFSVAHARLVDDLRRQSRRPADVPYDPGTDQRSAPSAEQAADERASADRATALLARLPEDQRSVLVLRIIADLSLAEVAAVIGRSEGAVKQLQRRGLLALKSEMAADA